MVTGDKKTLTRNVLSLGIVQVANYVLPLLSIPIISRILGPDKFGVINFAGAFVAYFTLIISYGFDLTATRKIAQDPFNEHKRSTIFSEVFYAKCLLFLFSTLVFTVSLFIVPELRSEVTVSVFSFLLCLATLFTQNWIFQAMQDLSKIALFNLISKLLFTIGIIVVIRQKEDYIWQPLLFSAVQIGVALASFLWAMKKYKIRFTKVPLSRCLVLLSEEKTVFFSFVVVSLYTTTNTVILGLYESAEQVGYYTAGQRLIITAQTVLTIPLAQALYPFIGKAFGESKELGLKLAQKILPIIILFTGVASLLMYLLGPYVLNLFYGDKFDAAIPVFQLLVFIPLIIAMSDVFGIQIMLNLKMDKYFFRITALGAVLSLCLNLLILPRWGYMGTAINWLVTELFISLALYITLRLKGINPFNKDYFKLSVFGEYLQPIRRKLFMS